MRLTGYSKAIRVCIRANANYYPIFKIISERDGSFYIVVLHNETHLGLMDTLEINLLSKENIVSIIGRSTSKAETGENRISYHSSGLVIYHGMQFPSANFDPVTRVKGHNWFFLYSIPALYKWCEGGRDEARDKDVVIDLSAVMNERIDFAFIVVPILNNSENENQILLNFGNLFCLQIEAIIDRTTLNFGSIYMNDEFVKIKPTNSKYPCVQCNQDQAYISFHRAINKKIDSDNAAIIYEPNSTKGFFEIIFSVPMRDVPKVKIGFSDPALEACDMTVDNYRLRFHLHHIKYGNLKTLGSASITLLELDADL
jgi:hypothetical protein